MPDPSSRVPTRHDEYLETLESGRNLQPGAFIAIRSEGFIIPSRGRWEGQLVDFCDIVDASTVLSSSHIIKLQCRKQMIGVILHRFLLLKLQINYSSGSETEKNEAFLRLDRRSDPTAGIGDIIRRGGATDPNDCVGSCATWARNARRLPNLPKGHARERHQCIASRPA
jgi:hypothetical protein